MSVGGLFGHWMLRRSMRLLRCVRSLKALQGPTCGVKYDSFVRQPVLALGHAVSKQSPPTLAAFQVHTRHSKQACTVQASSPTRRTTRIQLHISGPTPSANKSRRVHGAPTIFASDFSKPKSTTLPFVRIASSCTSTSAFIKPPSMSAGVYLGAHPSARPRSARHRQVVPQ